MKTVLIAGAGQLGSRHLQGVKTSKHELDIWVYDLSEDSLAVAERDIIKWSLIIKLLISLTH